jgi:hypothetical protein
LRAVVEADAATEGAMRPLRTWPTYAVVYALLYATQGVETCILWRWFAVPLGAPAMSIWNAVGLALIVGSVTYAPRVESKVGVEVTGRLQRAGIRLAVGFVCWVAMGGWR